MINADVKIHDNSKVNKGVIKIIVFKRFLRMKLVKLRDYSESSNSG